MKRLLLGLLAVAVAGSGCVSGGQVRADSEVIEHDIERARRQGAMKCAPRELATAEADVEFAQGELSEGKSGPANDHVKAAEVAIKRALELSKGCAPKQVLIEHGPPVVTPPTKKPVVIKIETADKDNDGVPDDLDKCPDQAEDKDGFQDEDGCPDPDNDGDGVLDLNDRCPNIPGPASNFGCPVPQATDKDGDGVPDELDKCPDQPEDKDGFQDEDGCPDPDNDGDGLVDAVDRCPNVAGPITNFGCPVLDKDGDGIPDNLDRCPDEPEDKDGFQDEDGCPDLDNDADGVPDTLDACPNLAGPATNHGCPVGDSDGDGVADDADKCPTVPGPKENAGCPWPDADHDGIPDKDDKCPDVPGTADLQGCPKKYKLVTVTKGLIEIKKQILFKTNSSKIIGRTSGQILGEVAQVLKDNPSIKHVRIEGHTDSTGTELHNLKLSQDRADSVKAALIGEGIEPTRLESIGYGQSKPIASNKTSKGRAKNRRTEFHIVNEGEQTPPPPTPAPAP
jgi:OOP family OmpA-OmpF porin